MDKVKLDKAIKAMGAAEAEYLSAKQRVLVALGMTASEKVKSRPRKRQPIQTTVMDALRNAKKAMKVGQITEATGIKSNQVRQAVWLLYKGKNLRKAGRGLWMASLSKEARCQGGDRESEPQKAVGPAKGRAGTARANREGSQRADGLVLAQVQEGRRKSLEEGGRG